MTRSFSVAQQDVIRWAAEECKRQRSGELSVAWMLDAWGYAKRAAQADSSHPRLPTEDDVIALARLVEPVVNADGYRRVGVRVGSDVKGPWQEVPRQIRLLLEAMPTLAPEDFYRSYEQIHPFRDGNGRTGTLLFNWLRGSLDEPMHPPDWDDPLGYWGVEPDYYMVASAMWEKYETKRGMSL